MDRDRPTSLLPSPVRGCAGLLLLACLLLGGCGVFGAKEQLRGNRVDADQLKELAKTEKIKNTPFTVDNPAGPNAELGHLQRRRGVGRSGASLIRRVRHDRIR